MWSRIEVIRDTRGGRGGSMCVCVCMKEQRKAEGSEIKWNKGRE